MSFRIVYKKTAVAELLQLPSDVAHRIRKSINDLSENPYPSGSKKLKGTVNCFRIRIGRYRVIYEISNSVLMVTIIKIAHRKSVYR